MTEMKSEIAVSRVEFEAIRQRLDQLETRQEITDLVHRYTEFIRMRTPGECASLMTDDAWVELHHSDAMAPETSEQHERFAGKPQILESYTAVAGEGTVVWPMIHNLRIEVDGDNASSRCVMASILKPLGEQYIGEYRDTFRREDGRWLFSSRQFVGYGTMGSGTGHDAHANFEARGG